MEKTGTHFSSERRMTMTSEQKEKLRRMYEMAILSQGACNLSGLAHDLSKATQLIWEEAGEQGQGHRLRQQSPHREVVFGADELTFAGPIITRATKSALKNPANRGLGGEKRHGEL